MNILHVLYVYVKKQFLNDLHVKKLESYTYLSEFHTVFIIKNKIYHKPHKIIIYCIYRPLFGGAVYGFVQKKEV